MDNFQIVDDPLSGLIRVTQRGGWSPTIVDAYFGALAAVVRRIRGKGGVVRILSDRRDCPAQSIETVERAGYHADRLFVPGDKSR